MTSNKDGLQFITNGRIIVVELRYIIDYIQTRFLSTFNIIFKFFILSTEKYGLRIKKKRQ